MSISKNNIDKPTPKWFLILVAIVEYTFISVAGGMFVVPDTWTWWKYVVTGAAFLAGLMNKIKPYISNESSTETNENSSNS